MRKNALNVIAFLLFAGGFTFLFFYADKNWLPKREIKDNSAEIAAAAEEVKKQESVREAKKTVGAVAGVGALGLEQARIEPIPQKPIEPPKKDVERQSITLIALGGDKYYNRVLLTTLGGGIQQVVLPNFDAADRLGREVKQKDENGKPTKTGVPFYLIPGIPRPRSKNLRDEYIPPDLSPGVVADPAALAEPSYTTFHYPNPDDKHPDPKLGEEIWKVVLEERPEGGTHKVVFETELGAPYFVKFRKTYTLGPKDYHVGLRIEIVRLPGGEKGKGQLRYQLSGPRGLPIEGEWYTTMYRVAIIGWLDRKGTPRRQYEEASTVAARRGGELVSRGSDNTFKYMAVATQFFASAVAIDDAEGSEKSPWSYIRATTELPFDKKSDLQMPYFDDVTVRAASDTIDLAPGETVAHSFLIYNGPSKIRLLGQMEGDRAVDEKLVERYQTKIGLETITDFRSDTWLGRFANAIYWTDLVIAFTNIMHWLLAGIHTVIPNWALCIVVLTVMVRLLLIIPSKKQTQMNLRMMEVQKKLAPQIEELKKKYADNHHEFNRAKMQLMMANGVNPFVAMGGCLLLIAQMPVMMGLYFCLQESVFFRLEPFIWVNNLAAPDMLFWWGESIPYISTPEDLGSFIYLGPYFNVLPLVAVALMIWQQKKMMPPPTDEQMAQQQKMMKYMMIMVAVMFYKVAAGLALYFIIGSIWGLIERRLIPKADDKKTEEATAEESGTTTVQTSAGAVEVPKSKGLLGRLRQAVQKRMEEMQRQADENSKRQIRNEKNGQGDNPARRETDRRDRKKKKRK